MRVLKSISFTAVAVALSVTSIAHAQEKETFEHDGVTYVYTVKQVGETQRITGYHYPAGSRFSLAVRNGTVTGNYNGTPVRFDVSEASAANVKAEAKIASLR